MIILPKIEQLNTDHGRFYRTPEGNVYPSVTTVLGSEGNEWLDDWRKAVGEEKAEKISARARMRGSRIHKYAENYLSGIENKYTSILDRLMFESLIPVLSNISNVQAIETGLYSDKIKVAGTVDLKADFENVSSIIDYKTSTRSKYKSEIEGYFIQTAAYSVCWEERTGEAAKQLVIILAVDQDYPQVFIENRDNWIDKFIDIRNRFDSKIH